jgi:cold shock CspA family protein
MQVPMQARDYQGVIKTKGDKYAFVECLELQPIFPGKDIFVNPKYVGDDVFNLLEAGTAVRFQYTMDAGKPRATSCSIAGGPTLGGVPRKRAAPVAAAATPPGEPLTFTGKIMSKSDKFGFIESAECRAQFGKDIFFIPKNIGDQVYEQMEIGKHVVVSVEIQDGRPRAVALLNME